MTNSRNETLLTHSSQISGLFATHMRGDEALRGYVDMIDGPAAANKAKGFIRSARLPSLHRGCLHHHNIAETESNMNGFGIRVMRDNPRSAASEKKPIDIPILQPVSRIRFPLSTVSSRVERRVH